ncbi:MAG: hypothetical protein DRN15_07175 [Thermoprotei archaeon]|nr:MAG: hypothetical protein DRN15_07175 [Thermoprotei archaeon]
MNYTLMAYIISLTIALAILAQPQTMIITLREESLEKTLALDYWLVVNALAYAYDKPNPEQAFISFLRDELQALDPRLVEVPNATIESLVIRQERVEAVIAFTHSWGIHRVHVLLSVSVLSRSSSYDPKRNIVVIKAKFQILSDKPVLVDFKTLEGELLNVKRYADQVYEVEVGITPNLRAKLLVMDSRGLKVVIEL